MHVNRARKATHLRCHPVTEVKDGNVVSVWPLVETQVSLQRVSQLREEMILTVNQEHVIIFLLLLSSLSLSLYVFFSHSR